MNKTLLVTFGCSWMAGIGVAYEPGMSVIEYKKISHRRENENKFSFRSTIAKNLNLDNKNFSQGGSSNQRQFRLAKNFFLSDYFNQARAQYDSIIVVWGITSVYRGELFNSELGHYKNFQLNHADSTWPVPKNIVTCSFDYQAEVQDLYLEMCYFNEFFKQQGIKNLWIDMFNHHDYRPAVPKSLIEIQYNNAKKTNWPNWEELVKRLYLQGTDPEEWNLKLDPVLANNIPADAIAFEKKYHNEIREARRAYIMHTPTAKLDNLLFAEDAPRDILSKLAKITDNSYHLSDWQIDSKRVQQLVDQGILNPYSNHPTKLGSNLIVDILQPHIKNLI